MALQLLFILLGLCLEGQKRQVQQVPCVCPQQTGAGTLTRLTLSAIMFRKASNTLSATAITHCIIPETRRGSHRSGAPTERAQPQLLANMLFGRDFRLTKEVQREHQVPHTRHPASPGINFAFVKTKNWTLTQWYCLNLSLYLYFPSFPTGIPSLFQDRIQDAMYHSVIMSPWSSPICVDSSVCSCLA